MSFVNKSPQIYGRVGCLSTVSFTFPFQKLQNSCSNNKSSSKICILANLVLKCRTEMLDMNSISYNVLIYIRYTLVLYSVPLGRPKYNTATSNKTFTLEFLKLIWVLNWGTSWQYFKSWNGLYKKTFYIYGITKSPLR